PGRGDLSAGRLPRDGTPASGTGRGAPLAGRAGPGHDGERSGGTGGNPVRVPRPARETTARGCGMSSLLHTATPASILRDARPASTRFAQAPSGLAVSVVSITGLEVWLLRRRTPLRYQQRFFGLQQVVTLLDVTEPIAHRAARIDHGCRSQGQRIGLADALIAATAMEGRL